MEVSRIVQFFSFIICISSLPESLHAQPFFRKDITDLAIPAHLLLDGSYDTDGALVSRDNTKLTIKSKESRRLSCSEGIVGGQIGGAFQIGLSASAETSIRACECGIKCLGYLFICSFKTMGLVRPVSGEILAGEYRCGQFEKASLPTQLTFEAPFKFSSEGLQELMVGEELTYRDEESGTPFLCVDLAPAITRIGSDTRLEVYDLILKRRVEPTGVLRPYPLPSSEALIDLVEWLYSNSYYQSGGLIRSEALGSSEKCVIFRIRFNFHGSGNEGYLLFKNDQGAEWPFTQNSATQEITLEGKQVFLSSKDSRRFFECAYSNDTKFQLLGVLIEPTNGEKELWSTQVEALQGIHSGLSMIQHAIMFAPRRTDLIHERIRHLIGRYQGYLHEVLLPKGFELQNVFDSSGNISARAQAELDKMSEDGVIDEWIGFLGSLKHIDLSDLGIQDVLALIEAQRLKVEKEHESLLNKMEEHQAVSLQRVQQLRQALGEGVNH